MNIFYLEFTLQSDAIFARGDGIVGLVDVDVQHDIYGLPYLAGRTLKGLLVEECADILESLERSGTETRRWEESASRLFGEPGGKESLLTIGDVVLPQGLSQAVANEIKRDSSGSVTAAQVLDSLTTIRRQTAIDPSGVPAPHTLRSVRAIIRETPFQAELRFTAHPEDDDLALLSVCVKALRRAGSNRNRGFGRLKEVKLLNENQQDVTQAWANRFFGEVGA